MATFQVHQDSEKENNTQFQQKERSVRPNVLQPIGGAIKEKQTVGGVRSNYATINNTNQQRVIGGASKGHFRQLGNIKVNDVVVAAKKTSIIPVEQFKTFSVYEDRSCTQNVVTTNEIVAAAKTTSINATVIVNSNTISSTTIIDDKENCYVKQSVQALKSSETIIQEDDFVLDTTPMSVSEVLSPMSVDRSQISHSTSTIIEDDDEDSQNKKLNTTEKEQSSLPRNDRQRFFEVVEYQQSILEYFFESEKKHRPKPHYMRRQADINYSMRCILVDWLVEVSEEYNLDTETLYLSVSYIDRFLSHMSVLRSKLQLVGTAAMFIASKYEEIYPPNVAEFVFITDDTYNKAQVLRMEQIILKILSFDLCTPTAYLFVNTYAVLADLPERLKFLTQYISELSLLEADPYLRFCPSLISASALALSRHILDECPIWSAELEEITTYRLEDLKEVLLHLCKSHNAATKLAQQAIQDKYKAEKYKQVSTIKPVELNEEQFEELAHNYNKKVSIETKATDAVANNENVRRMISLMFD